MNNRFIKIALLATIPMVAFQACFRDFMGWNIDDASSV